MDDRPASTLVVGLGNPLLGDDGVGWRIAEQVRRETAGAGGSVEVDCLAVGGLHLMERLVGYRCAVLIDAITTGRLPVGSLLCFAPEDLPNLTGEHLSSVHDATLRTALSVGRSLGLSLPETILIFGVEAEPTFDFGEALSPAVEASVSHVTDQIMEFLDQVFEKERT